MKGPHPTREETLELIQRRVKGKRQEDGWPDDIKVGYSPFGLYSGFYSILPVKHTVNNTSLLLCLCRR